MHTGADVELDKRPQTVFVDALTIVEGRNKDWDDPLHQSHRAATANARSSDRTLS